MASGLSDALLLIALGIGYLVVCFAHKEKKALRVSGYIVGFTIILLSAGYTFLNLWAYSSFGCPVTARYHHRGGIISTHMPKPQMHPWLPKKIPCENSN